MRTATPDAAESRFEIGNELRKRPISRARPGNQHIIGSGLSMRRQDARRCRAHPPLRAVAEDGIADFSARSEPDPHPGGATWFVRVRCGLHNQARPRRPPPGARHPKEVGADLQRFEVAAHKFVADQETAASGGKALAAFRPARCQHPPAGDRRHPRPETMTAFANQVAGLISTLHGCNSD